MTKKMLIDAAQAEEIRVALIDGKKVDDFDFEAAARKPLRGNIYLARVTRVEPSLQAAFVEYGGNRHGFLAFSEIHPDYYQIPVSDRKLLQEAEQEMAELAAELQLFQRGDDIADDEGEPLDDDRDRDAAFADDDDDDRETADSSYDDESVTEARDDDDDGSGRDRPRSRARRRRRGGSRNRKSARTEPGDDQDGDNTANATTSKDDQAGQDDGSAEGNPPDALQASSADLTAPQPNGEGDVRLGALEESDTEAVDVVEPQQSQTDDNGSDGGSQGPKNAPMATDRPPQITRDLDKDGEDLSSASDDGASDVSSSDDLSGDTTKAEDTLADERAGDVAKSEEIDADDTDDDSQDTDADLTGRRFDEDDRDADDMENDTDDDISDDIDNENGDADADDAPEEESRETDEERVARKKRWEDLNEQYREARRKHARILRNYKIQEVIKTRQILLVQVVKEERGNKGAALTSYLSLAGRYCVLMPNTARGGGISRKIPSSSDRKRLRRIVNELDVGQGMGLIIRTAGAKRTKTEIKRDYDYLLRLWENIRELTLKSVAPCLIYEEASLIKRAIRDLYDKDIEQVLVEGEAGYREAKDFMKMLMPSHAKNVQPYKGDIPLFLHYDVERQLDAMYQPTARLKSGGYLVIHQTEALIAVDVNSGKATRERNIEATALKTNIEAAQEVARQCKLRDLAGLIVIDFIDMEESKNNRTVERKLKDAMKNDRARIQIGRISPFGLLEMSRQRRRSGIVDGTTHVCPTCQGAGAVRSHETAALRILRAIEAEAISGRAAVISVRTSLDVALFILNHKRAWLNRIEDHYALAVEIISDSEKAGDHYEIDKRGAPRERTDRHVPVRADLAETGDPDLDDEAQEIPDPDDALNESDDASGDGEPRKRRRRRRRSGDESDAASKTSDADPDLQSEDSDESGAQADSSRDDSEDKPKRRRRRGRRSGRRNRGNREPGSENTDTQEADSDEASAKTSGDKTNHDSRARPEADAETTNAQPVSNNSDPAGLTDATSGASQREEGPAGADADPHPSAKPAPEPERPEPALMPNDGPTEAAQSPSHEPQKQADDEKKPRRKGWWQRALGG